MRGSMRIMLMMLLLSVFSTVSVYATAKCALVPSTIALKDFDNNNVYAKKLNLSGSMFAVVDNNGDGYIWSLETPTTPPLKMPRDRNMAQKYVDVYFSNDSTYVIFDSTVVNTNLETHGLLFVLNVTTGDSFRVKTFIWGGNQKSKFAWSSSGLFAYVPDKRGVVIEVFNPIDNSKRTIVDDGCVITALAFNQDKEIAIKDTCGKNIRVRNAETGALIHDLSPTVPISDDVYSPERSLFYWAEGTMLAASSDANGLASTFNANSGHGSFPTMWMAPLPIIRSYNTKTYAIADFEGNINVLHMNDDEWYMDKPFGFEVLVTAAAFSLDDTKMALGSANGDLSIIDTIKLETQCSGTLPSGPTVDILAYGRDQIITYGGRALTKWKIVSYSDTW